MIRTERLEIVPATWPPEYLDPASLEFTLERLAEGPGMEGWWLHFVLLRDDGGGRTLVGSAGYKGPPTADGTVEVGYGIVSDHRRRGYASETVRGLLAHAFARPAVRRTIAETLPDLTPSIGVLRKCGFRSIELSGRGGRDRRETGDRAGASRDALVAVRPGPESGRPRMNG